MGALRQRWTSLKQLQINMGNTYIMDLQKYSNILCGFSHEQTKPLGQIFLRAKLHITEPLRQNYSKLVNFFRQIMSYFLGASANNLTFQELQCFLLYAWPRNTETLRQKCMELSFECGYKLFNQVHVSGSQAHWNSNY